jgi:hypothetical protein
MKKRSFFIFSIFLLQSCFTQKVIPLKGTYPPTPIVYNSDNSFDKVWDKTIDYFAQNGIPIRIIDKSSGLIISDKSKLSWSFEDKKGKIENPNVFVVIPSVMDVDRGRPFKPESVMGEWNIRIKSSGSGSSINVNLYNIQATYGRSYYSSYSHSIIEPITLEGRTTGMFEKELSDMVK